MFRKHHSYGAALFRHSRLRQSREKHTFFFAVMAFVSEFLEEIDELGKVDSARCSSFFDILCYSIEDFQCR
jgi:hypothetical protein